MFVKLNIENWGGEKIIRMCPSHFMILCNRYRASLSPNSILSVTPADSSPVQGFQRGGCQIGLTSDKIKGLAMIPRKAPQLVVDLKSSPLIWNLLPGCAVPNTVHKSQRWWIHDENQATCRSTGENHLVDHLVEAFHSEVLGGLHLA